MGMRGEGGGSIVATSVDYLQLAEDAFAAGDYARSLAAATLALAKADDRLIQRTPKEQLLRSSDLTELLGFKAISRLVRDRGFPKPILLTPSEKRWSYAAVMAWIAAAPRADV
jgi:predicted DNA-binding transcriptional regulator AlpA